MNNLNFVSILGGMQEHQSESSDTVSCLTSSMGMGGGYVPLVKYEVNMDKDSIDVIGNYSASNHNASRIVNPTSISPTVMENHGTVTGVAIPIMNPSIINKQQHGRRFKEDEEPMFTLTAQDVHGVGIGVNQIGRRLDTARDNPQRNRVYDPNGISPSLNGIGNGGNLEPQIPVAVNVQPCSMSSNVCDMEDSNTLAHTLNTADQRKVFGAKQERTMAAVTIKPNPVCIAGFGEKNSNGGSQYYQQDRVYDGTKVATTLSHQLPGGSNYYSIPLETDEDNTMKEELPKIVEITIADPEDTKEHPDIYVEFSTGLKVYAIWYEKYNCYITIRKLTPKECFRLQSFPDYLYERAAFVNSDSQLYKQAGNAITSCIAYEIGKKLAEIE